MRVVIDTNVFVGACLGSPPSKKVIAKCLTGQLRAVMGTALFLEYESILGRENLFEHTGLEKGEREDLLDIFLSTCIWTPIYFGWRPNLPDEGDNHLVELAVAGNAQYIVTRNVRDLVHGDLNFPSIGIISPEAFLQEVE